MPLTRLQSTLTAVINSSEREAELLFSKFSRIDIILFTKTKMIAFNAINMRVRIPEGTDCSNQFEERWLPSWAGTRFVPFSLWQLLLDLCRNLNHKGRTGFHSIFLQFLAISCNFIWDSPELPLALISSWPNNDSQLELTVGRILVFVAATYFVIILCSYIAT